MLDSPEVHVENALRSDAHYGAGIAAITGYGGAAPAAELDSRGRAILVHFAECLFMDVEQQCDNKADCVVIDSNVWRSELLLRTPLGVSFVYTLGRQRGFIGLPEVVEGELTRQIMEVGDKARQTIEESSRILSILTDSPCGAFLPSETDVRKKVADRIDELAPLMVRVPFTLEHAKAALEMVNAKMPPNGEKNQQFKDSALWRAVLTLSSDYCVHLVTNDRAFLLDRGDPSRGLAKNLQADCDNLSTLVGIYCDLRTCLAAIRRDAPTVDTSRVLSSILPALEIPLRKEATRHRFVPGEVLSTDVKAYRIPAADRLAIDYIITKECEEDASLANDDYTNRAVPTNICAIVHGSCYYAPNAGTVFDNIVQCITIKWDYVGGGRGSSIYEPRDLPTVYRRPIA